FFAPQPATLNGVVLTPVFLLRSVPLPDVIARLPLTIAWEVSVNNAGEWMPAGVTSDTLYGSGVDLRLPVRHTVLDVPCRGALGWRPAAQGDPEPRASAANQLVIDGVWHQFERPANVKNVQGAPLTYWGAFAGPGGQPVFDTAGLLLHRDGRC